MGIPRYRTYLYNYICTVYTCSCRVRASWHGRESSSIRRGRGPIFSAKRSHCGNGEKYGTATVRGLARIENITKEMGGANQQHYCYFLCYFLCDAFNCNIIFHLHMCYLCTYYQLSTCFCYWRTYQWILQA